MAITITIVITTTKVMIIERIELVLTIYENNNKNINDYIKMPLTMTKNTIK